MNAAFQRVGLVVNSAAGAGAEQCFQAASQAISALGATDVVTGPGLLGEDSVKSSALRVEILSCDPATGRDGSRALARLLADHLLETVVVVGGDGTMADVAGIFVDSRHQPNILGVGAGSTNAGSLVTCLADEVSQLDKTNLVKRSLDALEVKIIDGPSAIAFNDVVFSSTIVATAGGKLVDLDAAAFLEGRSEPVQPRCIGASGTLVKVAGPDADSLLSSGPDIGTIVVGFAEQAFRAKAITGGICLATHVGFHAGCLVADRPIAYFGATAESLLADGPIHTTFFGLDDSSKVLVSGVKKGAVICADGNPVSVLDESSQVQIKIRLSAITALTMQEQDQ